MGISRETKSAGSAAFLCLLLALSPVFISPALPQETPAPPSEEKKETPAEEAKGTEPTEPVTPAPEAPPAFWEIRYQEIESWLEGDVRITHLTGGAQISQQDMWIRAENIIGWFDEKAAKERRERGEEPPKEQSLIGLDKVEFDEIYAEGFVRMKTETELVTSDGLYMNFRTSQGIMVNTLVRTKDAKRNLDVVLRAKTIRQLDARTFQAEEGSLTTCTFADPHYQIGVKSVEFKRGSGESGRASLTHIVPEAGGFPIFYWPMYFLRLGQGSPLRNFKFEKSGRYGVTVKTKWGFDLNRYRRDANGEIERDEDGAPKEKRWGRLLFDIDYFSMRGTGYGPGLEYEWEDYEGLIQTYYIRDRGPDDKDKFGRRFLPLEDRDRGRAKLYHRHYLDSLVQGLRMDMELSYVSDRNFLEEFFEREFKESKEQESYLYLRYVNGNKALTGLERLRMNDFQNQVEYSPAVAFTTIAEPLVGERLYYTTITEFDNVRNKYDDELDLDSERIWRFDTYNEFGYPISAKPVNFVPFLGARFTGFEDAVNSEGHIDRFIGSAGTRISTQLQRVYETNIAALGIFGIRHTALFEVRYTNNYECSQKPDELYLFDAVDQASAFEEVSFEERHRFETKDSNKENPIEFMNMGYEIEYYPDHVRDTDRMRAQNYMPPFNWINNYPDKDGEYKHRNWSNLNADLTVSPRGIFSFSGEAEYDTYTSDIDVSTVTITATPKPELRTSIYHRFLRGIADTIGTNIEWEMTEIWGLELDFQYDFMRGTISDQTYVLKRNLHDFMLEFSIDIDEGKDDTTYSMVLYPKAMPKAKVRF
ncbi:MAG: LPS assembly protein LptD [Planctomycetota bacterium]|nr:LPS assembly protein LptD [Planctomycetota bacterium]